MERKVKLHSLGDRVEIAGGVLMPRLGLGTADAPDGHEVENAVMHALNIGYRGVDTASIYLNERSVGRALRASGLPRDNVFVATKVWNSDQGYDSTLAACERSLSRLGLEYVDLYLVHWPDPEHDRDTWRAMEELRATNKVRAIGVCNHLTHHLEELLSAANVPPAVNQIEYHPRLQRPDLRRFCEAHNIIVQAWSPLMLGQVADVPELVEIGLRHGKTAAQVSLRWILQHGVTAIPKSIRKDRIIENADVFDFALTGENMATIDGLDAGVTRQFPPP